MRRLFPRLTAKRPSRPLILEGLGSPQWSRLRLDRFPRGVDNCHIDVLIGPALLNAAEAYVGALVLENVQRLWKRPETLFSDTALKSFRQLLQEHHRAVVGEARALNRVELVQLYQLALLKLLLDLIDTAIDRLRVQLGERRDLPERHPSGGPGPALHQQVTLLARHAGHVRYRSARQIMGEMMRLEHGGMRNLRKSALGLSWPVAEGMLRNPLLQLDGFGSLRDFSHEYPIVLHDIDVLGSLDRFVLRTFAEWLPADLAVAAHDHPDVRRGTETGGTRRAATRGLLEIEQRVRHLFHPAELDGNSSSWLDLPENAMALMGGGETPWPAMGPWENPAVQRLQRDLSSRLDAALRHAGLLRAVFAAYEMAAIYPALGLIDLEAPVYRFLRGDLSRKELARRLSPLPGTNREPVALVRRIDELRREYRRRPESARGPVLARFAGDFCRLRRDLKLAWRVLGALDTVRLIRDQHELVLAQDNNTLQVFCREEIARGSRGSVSGHLIVQAELRGTDQVMLQMRARNLNPAVHFSRYLFDPVAALLEPLEAQRVLVEADMLVFALLEYGGDGAPRLAAARACCLSQRLLEIGARMNAEHERIGLVPIEMGIAVAHAAEAPAYLFDQGRKITVSPAIRRTRRFAACHPLLRQACPLPGGQGLCVASPVHGGDGENDGAGLVRMNINAIELDAAAFAQLNVEIPLRRLRVRNGQSPRGELLYVGSCADTRGESHLLIIRQRPIRLWMGGQLVDADGENGHFYEVVSDERLAERLRQRLAADSPVGDETAHSARPLP